MLYNKGTLYRPNTCYVSSRADIVAFSNNFVHAQLIILVSPWSGTEPVLWKIGLCNQKQQITFEILWQTFHAKEILARQLRSLEQFHHQSMHQDVAIDFLMIFTSQSLDLLVVEPVVQSSIDLILGYNGNLKIEILGNCLLKRRCCLTL